MDRPWGTWGRRELVPSPFLPSLVQVSLGVWGVNGGWSVGPGQPRAGTWEKTPEGRELTLWFVTISQAEKSHVPWEGRGGSGARGTSTHRHR